MAKVTFDEQTCKGCELCVVACPKGIVVMAKDRLNNKGFHPAEVLDMDKCNGCTACAIMCPDTAIIVER